MEREYTGRLEKIEAVLAEALKGSPDILWANENFGPFRTPPEEGMLAELNAPARDLLSRGGKRWRPLLLVLACELGGGGEKAYPLVPLIELAHNGSLILDDIEDRSDMRRGKPAVHMIYGEDTAINSGCLLYFLASQCLASFSGSAELKLLLFERYSHHMRRLHLGQAMDISWHRDSGRIPPRSQYYLMCGMKTGCLARMAAEFGFLAASRGFPESDELGKVFEDAGIAYQILDDVKNLKKGNPGKKRGDDVVEGKKSLPLILMLEKRPDLRKEAERCMRQAAAEGPESGAVEGFIALAEESGALDEAERLGMEMLSEAKSKILSNYPESAERERLTDLLDSLA